MQRPAVPVNAATGVSVRTRAPRSTAARIKAGASWGLFTCASPRASTPPRIGPVRSGSSARTSAALSTSSPGPTGGGAVASSGGRCGASGSTQRFNRPSRRNCRPTPVRVLDRGRPVGPERQARLGQGRQGRRIFTAQVGSEQTGGGPACSPSDPSPLDDGHRQPALGQGPRQGPADDAASHHQHVGPTAHMMIHASAQGTQVSPHTLPTPPRSVKGPRSRPIGVDRRGATT